MKLIFVRHGEPLKDAYGIADMGKAELKLLADFLVKNHEIDAVYAGTSQRATESVAVLNELIDKEIVFCDWLSEFKHKMPEKYKDCEFPWEFPPGYWMNDERMLDHKLVLEETAFKWSDIPKQANRVWSELDALIEQNGYKRDGNLYKAVEPNEKVILIVTHFATMAVMIAHLWNISILVALNMLFMAPSSYTVVSTEEIIQGTVLFRCLELGSTKHLYGRDDLLSEYGRQAEIYEGEDVCGE